MLAKQTEIDALRKEIEANSKAEDEFSAYYSVVDAEKMRAAKDKAGYEKVRAHAEKLMSMVRYLALFFLCLLVARRYRGLDPCADVFLLCVSFSTADQEEPRHPDLAMGRRQDAGEGRGRKGKESSRKEGGKGQEEVS